MAWWLWLLVQLVVLSWGGLVVVLWWLWVSRPRVDAPGPPTLPIIGNVLEFREMPLTIRKLKSLHDKYGDLARFYLGPVLMMMVTHPDDVQHIMLTCKMVDRDPFLSSAMGVFVRDGLLTMSGPRWKAHRKLINPTFHSEVLERFLEAFHEGALFLAERLDRTKGAPTEVHAPATLATLRTVCNTIVGIDPDIILPDAVAEDGLASAIRGFVTTVMKITVQPWMQNRFLLWLTPTGREVLNYVNMLEETAMEMIALRSSAPEDGPSKTRLCLLEALVKPGGKIVMPLDEVKGELMNMVMAGTETTAVTLSFALASLAHHPEWQDAARQELRDVFGDGDDYLQAANMADLNRLRVMDSIIKETLRLFSVVPVVTRKAHEDIWLSGGRVLVPKGALLVVVNFLTQRLPQFFPDPLRFDPSRFLDDRVSKEHPCSYLPFGVGARNCVGYQYARLQLKVILATLLRRFRFLPHSRWEELEDITTSLTLHPSKPIRVSCVPLHELST